MPPEPAHDSREMIVVGSNLRGVGSNEKVTVPRTFEQLVGELPPARHPCILPGRPVRVRYRAGTPALTLCRCPTADEIDQRRQPSAAGASGWLSWLPAPR